MNNSIVIKNVSKEYKVYPSRYARLKEWLVPFSKKKYKSKWVLKNINLEVKAGEAVGIIGMNGAGKSTILKIITGTTVPTTGSVKFNGTVSALLELGLGFHPDFTGRQNAYMSGQLLGYSIEEIDGCMAKVEEFAEIGDAIDAPVRTYSSGMQVRLAFSVATMKRPDILIVDEALSVGDTYFQHKSFGRIKEFCDRGTTLLLVSHDVSAIQAVCNRAVLLDKGQVLQIGRPEEIMDYYNAMLGGNNGNSIKQVKLKDGRIQTISGNGDAQIISVKLLNKNNRETENFDVGERVKLCVEAKVCNMIEGLTCGILIKNRFGESVYGINSFSKEKKSEKFLPKTKVYFNFLFPLNLGDGNYSISVALHKGTTHEGRNYEWRDLAVSFNIVNISKKHFAGVVFLDTVIEIKSVNNYYIE